MGKSTQKKTSSQPVKAETTSETPALVQEPAFSNGDLGQLQEILFGAQQRTTNDQITALQDQVTEQIQTLGNMLNSRINQLTETFDKNSKENDRKLGELKADQQASISTLSKKMDKENQQLESTISSLVQSTGDSATRFQTELKSTEQHLQTQLQDAQDSLHLEIKSSVDHLQGNKLDKKNLAQLLGEVSKQLAKSDSAASN